jgi:DNA-binding response OmpR family regulator
MSEPIKAAIHTLVVDDEDALRFFIQETLRRAGYQVEGASSGEEAMEKLRDTHYDLLMLDLMLGGRVDGLKVLEMARWRWPDTVVVILTAHGSLKSAMAAIREGVDGYLLKPVEPGELRQAVSQALDRRRIQSLAQESDGQEHVIERAPFVVDTKKHEATLEGAPLDLTPREFNLLVHLMRNADRAISPQELVRVVREYDPIDAFEARDICKWYIHRLRRKIEPDPSSPQYVLNVRGVGYRFGIE